MALSRLIGCNVYISEGRNLQLIRRLEALCHAPPYVALANTFVDQPYHRTGFTLVSANATQLSSAVLTVAEAALSAVDLRNHAADHPRLGVLDHVSLHPLGSDATLQLAAEAATLLGQHLSAAPFGIPVYYYGAAHPAGRRLADIRRKLGYFRVSNKFSISPMEAPASISSSSISDADWVGSLPTLQLSHYPPDAGPSAASAAAGVVTIGAVPWVLNYNVPLYTADRAAAAAVARAVSTRGRGLPGVEAMALQHGPGVIEVATNLVDLDWRTYNSSSSWQATSTLPQKSLTTAAAIPSHAGSAEIQQHITGVEAAASAHPAGTLQQHPPTAAVPSAGSMSSSSEAAQAGSGSVQAPAGATPSQVQAAVAAAAQQHGLPPPGAGYVTNKLPHELIEVARQMLDAS